MSLTPPERFRDSLIEQRGRGVHFDIAWDVAISSQGRHPWRPIFMEQREEWRRAYEHEDTALGKANRGVVSEGVSSGRRIAPRPAA